MDEEHPATMKVSDDSSDEGPQHTVLLRNKKNYRQILSLI